MQSIDLLFLLKGEDIVNSIDDTIKAIIGADNVNIYDKWKKKMRIVILLDGYDEIWSNLTQNPHFLDIRKRPEKNITFAVSARTDKIGEIVGGGRNAHKWNIIRCKGIQNDCVAQLFVSLNEADNHKRHKILNALQLQNLHQNPLFIFIALEVFAEKDYNSNIELSMYSLMTRLYDNQVDKYVDITKEFDVDNDRFANTLGWYAIDSGAVELVNTVNESFKPRFEENFRLRQAVDKKLANLMDVGSLCSTACKTGLLTRFSKQNLLDLDYTFLHKTVAEYAVAKLLYNTNMWLQAHPLNQEDGSMVQYYVLQHSICMNNNDTELWNVQLEYSFSRSFVEKGIISHS